MKTIAIAPYVLGSIVANLEHQFGKTGKVQLTKKHGIMGQILSRVQSGMKSFTKTLEVEVGTKKSEVNKIAKAYSIGDAPAEWNAKEQIAAASYLEYNLVFAGKPVSIKSGKHLAILNTLPIEGKVYNDVAVAIPLKTKGDTLWVFPPSSAANETELLVKVSKFIKNATKGKAVKHLVLPQFYLDQVPTKTVALLKGAKVGTEENQMTIGMIGANNWVGTMEAGEVQDVELPKGTRIVDGDFTIAIIREGHQIPFFVATVGTRSFLKG